MVKPQFPMLTIGILTFNQSGSMGPYGSIQLTMK